MEIQSIYHGFTSAESELVVNLLKKNKISLKQIEELLKLERPGRNEFYYQQAVAGLIPENEKMDAKWQFIRDDYNGTECLLLLKEFVLDEKADQKLAKIVAEIEKLEQWMKQDAEMDRQLQRCRRNEKNHLTSSVTLLYPC